jgi:hypothetical protein
LDLNNDLKIGSDNKKIHINTKLNLFTSNFDSENHFTQGSIKIDGVIKRDLNFNTNFSQSSKLESDDYDQQFKVISLDPFSSPNNIVTSSRKNPPFVEQREIIYEFQKSSDVQDDLFESSLYGTSPTKKPIYDFPNRRLSRADTLSLSLVAPNFLMETVKGTVVDIFGNILDLNRTPLPIGQGSQTLRSDKSDDKTKSFISIKELERKSLAYHFEINTRKDLTSLNGQLSLPNINSNSDYARSRSRFFFDIDKEGQFKLNVPASSEKGNIPLLTRYENYSTFGTEDNNNPNKLIYREDNLDIFLDSFAASPTIFEGDSPKQNSNVKGSISVKNDSAESSPVDRIVNTPIKHGTAHHDILKTCYAHQTLDFLNYQTDDLPEQTVNISLIPNLQNVVSDTIQIGQNANAGGRSGQINFDGSLELNIGANTVDRQSLWLDTAGGIVANIGRDKKNMSAAISMNGDLFLQVGGIGVSGDSRFVTQNNGQIGAVVDLRVFTDGLYAHLIRLDRNGISIMTPGNMNIHAKGKLRLTSGSDVEIEGESVIMQGRLVLKELGGSI